MKGKLFAIKLFVLIWIIALLLLWILPISSKFESSIDGVILSMVFVFVIAITAIFWYQRTKTIVIKNRLPKDISLRKIKFIIKWSSILTITGNIFVFIDRVFIRGIDYSLGFRNARYQWDALGGGGSIISVLGNLMIPFSYCALFMGIFHWEALDKRSRLLGVIIGFAGQFFIAMMNGGRSNILLSLIFALVVCVIRKYMHKRFLPKFRGRTIWIILGGMAVLIYVRSILYAFTGNDLRYLILSVDGAGAKLDPNYVSNPFMNTFIEISLYLLHGNFYTAQVIAHNPSLSDLNHNISLRGIMVLLARTPLFSSYKIELPNFDSGNGNFIALPGILLYDYGYIGFFIVCIVFGILFGETLKILTSGRENFRVRELVLVICVLIHAFMSVITVALSFGYFVFMIFALIAMELIAARIYGSSGWIKLKMEDRKELYT